MIMKWNYVDEKTPQIDVEVLVSVDKEICEAENDFVSTDFYTGENWEINTDCVYAWATIPEAYNPKNEDNGDWVTGFPENNGFYLVTIKVLDKTDNTDNFCVFVLEYNKEITIDPWDLKFHYECDKEDGVLGQYIYEYMAYMYLPEVASK